MNWLPGKSILGTAWLGALSGFTLVTSDKLPKPHFFIFKEGIITVPKSQYATRTKQDNVCKVLSKVPNVVSAK